MSKFNWGHGIAVFYVLFVATLAIVLIRSFSIDHSLVVDDYYAKDITYQSQYDKAKNSLSNNQLKINYDKEGGQVTLDFAMNEPVSGTIQFYRPSDKAKDFDVKITGNSMQVPIQHLPQGKWKVKVDWSRSGKAYYNEEEFYF